MTEPLTKEERERMIEATRASSPNRCGDVRSWIRELEIENRVLHLRIDKLEESALYQDILADKLGEARAELARLRPLAEAGEAVSNLPPGFFIGNGLYGGNEWVVICENEEDGRLFPRINARDAAEALHIVDELAALRAARGDA